MMNFADISEALHCSGIITALVTGLICNRYAIENLSGEAREYARSVYTILSEMADELIMISMCEIDEFRIENEKLY